MEPDRAVEAGILYVVATPIGNRGDLSARAAETILNADLVACEKPDKLSRLFPEETRLPPIKRYHDPNEQQLFTELSDAIGSGQRIALVSEAGTPGISDPGFRLVRECRKRGLPVVAIPGPAAVISALSVSGLPTDGFFFRGFLPPKSAARRRFFEEYQNFGYTIVLYESTHRITKFLNDLVEILGEKRIICVCRELTKLHETVFTGPAGDAMNFFASHSTKGEFTVLIAKLDYEL